MAVLSRADNSTLGRWWWTIDRWTLGAIGVLIGVGYIMMLAASPAVAERIGQSRDIFILKQVVFLALAGAVVVGVSLLSPREVRRLALAGCLVAVLLTTVTLVSGVEIKGARRWISIPGMTLQPSEFLKPCFAVVAAWLISEGHRATRVSTGTMRLSWGMPAAIGIFLVIAFLLKSQPDIGMLAVVASVFFIQLYIGGLPIILVAIGALGLGGAAAGAYVMFPHVQARVQKYLNPTLETAYQPTLALEAFGNGGLLGRGPGEGRVKNQLPDAHADFVYAVAGEEFGLIVCLLILAIFAFIVLRGVLRLLHEQDLFVTLACAGLVSGFGLQAFVNMASRWR